MTFLFEDDLHLVSNKNTLKTTPTITKNRKQQKDENANKE
jgi:hypothetical protein